MILINKRHINKYTLLYCEKKNKQTNKQQQIQHWAYFVDFPCERPPPISSHFVLH